MKKKIDRNAEFVSYIIAGVLTTGVNLVIYFAMIKLFSTHYQTANIIAFFISVLFAYFINKIWVFKVKRDTIMLAFGELLTFMVSRVGVLVGEIIILFIMIDALGISDIISKLITNIIVAVANYLLGKKIVFVQKV